MSNTRRHFLLSLLVGLCFVVLWCGLGVRSQSNITNGVGSASPEGSVSAQPGSTYINTSLGKYYVKTSGTGNTGWTEISAELPTWPVSSYVISKPSSSQVVVRFVFDRAMTIPAQTNGVNAYVKAGTSATAQTDFTMSKNGAAAFCTLRFAASGTQATFQTCSATDFAAGDVLTIVAPSSQDATLADIGFSITARMQ